MTKLTRINSISNTNTTKERYTIGLVMLAPNEGISRNLYSRGCHFYGLLYQQQYLRLRFRLAMKSLRLRVPLVWLRFVSSSSRYAPGRNRVGRSSFL